MSIALGTIGVWQFTPKTTSELAARAEGLEYGTFWIGGSPLSAARCAGAHPYPTTPEHTAYTRKIIESDALLAPEHKVVLDTDVERARTLGRKMLKRYLPLVN